MRSLRRGADTLGRLADTGRIYCDEHLPALMSLRRVKRRKDCVPPLLAMLLSALVACGKGAPEGSRLPVPTGGDRELSAKKGTMSSFSEDSTALLDQRAAKDEAFRREGSPIPKEALATFAGLSYYPPNGALVVEARLEKVEPPEPVSIAATKGDIRSMLRYGMLRFTVGGTPCTLTAFTSRESPTTLFVPFKDRTNGSETYEVGRYIGIL